MVDALRAFLTLTWLDRFCCGLRGHDALPVFEKERMYLRCGCGWTSAGWTLTRTGPKPKGKSILRFKRRMAA